MTPERHQLIASLYHEAMALPAGERAAWLDRACADDATLRVELVSLLASADRMGAFIETPALAVAAQSLAEERAAAAQGELLGHYRIDSLLGVGGMGEVWLAEDITLGRQVALKLLPPHFTQNPDRVARFAVEARAASALNHPNILTIYETGQTEHGHFIATEYVKGRTLRALLQAGPLDALLTLDLVAQIASALEAAHQAGVIHRDIKPENVMRRDDGFVKVLDFGLAELRADTGETASQKDSETASAAARASLPAPLGTLRYLSPEQARGESVDARSDLFSLGIVLYEMLAGRAPFAGKSAAETMQALHHATPAPLPDAAPARLRDISARLLRKEPAERYATAGDLWQDLRALKRDLEFKDELARQQPVMPAVMPARRRPLAYAAACGALLLAAFFSYRWLTKPMHAGLTLTAADTVLLADFDNQTGEAIFDGTLQQALVAQLAQTPFLNLLTEGQKRDMLKLMSRQPNEPLTPALARELCQRRSLKAFLRGSLARRAAAYVFTLEAVNARNGVVVAQQQAVADEPERVLPALGATTRQFRAQLGESLASLQRFNTPVENVTTVSLEALKAYVEARKLMHQGKVNEAAALYQHALQLDGNFASAAAGLAALYYSDDQLDRATEAAQRAYALKDRVSERERFSILDFYYAVVTEEIEKDLEILKLHVQTYPRDFAAFNNLGTSYNTIGAFAQAEQAYRAAWQLEPNTYHVYANLGMALIRQNRFDEARQITEEALRRNLDNIDIRENLYVLAEIKDDAEAMQRRAAEMKGQPRATDALVWQARTAVLKGQFKKAAEFSRLELAEAERANDQGWATDVLAGAASRLTAYGQCGGLAPTVARMLKNGRSQSHLSDAAFWSALCGKTQAARVLLDELQTLKPPRFNLAQVQTPITRAVIALRRQQPAAALAELESTRQYDGKRGHWAQYVRALAHQRLRQYDAALSELRAALDHRGWSPSSKVWPLLHLELARTYRLRGDAHASRQAYEALFQSWKDADHDLPQWLAAKQEYEKLK